MNKNIFLEKKYEINENTGINVSKRKLTRDFETHTHDFFEIEFILSGKALHTINGYSYEIGKGDIYLLKPSDFHSLRITEPLEYMSIMFSEQAVSTQLLYNLTESDKAVFYKLSNEDYNNILSVFELMIKAYNTDGLNIGYIKNLCECVMMIILRTAEIKPHTLQSNRSIYKTILYIKRNFRCNISLDRLAEEACLSKNYFCSQFKSIFGMSTVDYINSIRLSYAHNLLISTDLPITNICFNSGFGSYSVFSRAFKKHYGCSPSDVRRT